MTHRRRFFAVLEGRPTDRPALFPDISDWYAGMRTPPGQPRTFGCGDFLADDDPLNKSAGAMPKEFSSWTYLDFYRKLDWGLPVHIYGWLETHYDGVEQVRVEQGSRRITRLRCCKGELTRVEAMAGDGSWCPVEHYVKSLCDLEVMRHLVERTHYRAKNDLVSRILEEIGEQGVGDIPIMRSPFGKLVHEFMGFEQTVFALHDERQSILDYLAFQEQADLKVVELAARTPARIVILSDHADENLIAPPLYRQFCVPYYQKIARILHDAGKVVSTHLDGNFRGYLPFIHEAHFDLLDGCTPAPMMNYQVEELAAVIRKTWTESPADSRPTNCYLGVPATLFCQELPDEVIVSFGRRILEAFNGRVILNVGDILPPNGNLNQVIRLGRMAAGWGAVNC
jgi:uroporphyrinogen-III decarboxylase